MDVVSLVLDRHGYKELNPVQREAVEKGLLEGRNIVVSAPTSSGKTLIGEMAILRSVLRGKKAVYTSPLRALALEHYKEFRRLYPDVKTALSIGDYGVKDERLGRYDVIFTTYEKLDVLMRNGAEWTGDVGTLVVDEIHMIDSDRGPTLEFVMARIPREQIVGLSATIPNADELALWLDAELVVSDWRPTTLVEGVYYNGRTIFVNGEEWEGEWEETVKKHVEEGKPVLIFVPTRSESMKLAKRLSDITKGRYGKDEPRILEALETPTKQCELLYRVVKRGTAFHHAGLVNEQREIVEDLFRSGRLGIVVATPTLAAGVNMPASLVVITSLKRSEMGRKVWISVREYKQMAGRAGRAKYGKEGRSIILTRTEREFEIAMEEYVKGEPEIVVSRLHSPETLAFHVLGLLVEGYRLRDLEDVIKKTFYGFTGGTPNLVRALQILEGYQMLEDGEPTLLGTYTARLYLQPSTGYRFFLFSKDPTIGELPVLYVLSSSKEFYPYVPVRKREEVELLSLLEEREAEIGKWVEEEDPYFLEKFKLALILEEWINETEEGEILDRYGVTPGTLFTLTTIATWMARSLGEIARIGGSRVLREYALRLERRLEYGVREELLPLIELKGIGRVRARALYNMGIKKPEDIRSADPSLLVKVLGRKTAVNVMKQIRVEEERIRRGLSGEQTTLEEW